MGHYSYIYFPSSAMRAYRTQFNEALESDVVFERAIEDDGTVVEVNGFTGDQGFPRLVETLSVLGVPYDLRIGRNLDDPDSGDVAIYARPDMAEQLIIYDPDLVSTCNLVEMLENFGDSPDKLAEALRKLVRSKVPEVTPIVEVAKTWQPKAEAAAA